MQNACRRSYVRPLRVLDQHARCSSSHDDHHHAVDYQYLEKPAMKPEDFTLFGNYKTFESVPELQSANIVKAYGNLIDAKNKPEVCWSQQVMGSPAVLACFAELFSSEFRFLRHNISTMKGLYRQQHAAFTYVRTPQLQAEGISQVTIDLLEEMYAIRANISDFQLKRALEACGINRDRERTWLPPLGAWFRQVTGKPLVENPNEGQRDSGIDSNNWYRFPLIRDVTSIYRRQTRRTMLSKLTHELKIDNQVHPDGFANFEEYAALKTLQVRLIQNLIKAIDRGLTQSERDRMVAKLKEFQGMNPIDADLEREMTVAITSALDRYNSTQDKNEFLASLSAFGKRFVEDSTLSAPSRVHAKQLSYKALLQIGVELPGSEVAPEDEDGLYFREGVDYFSGDAQRKSVISEITAWFKYTASVAHHDVMTTGSAENKQKSTVLKQALDLFLSPVIQSDLEILQLLRTSNLSHKQQHEFLRIFEDEQTKGDVELSEEVKQEIAVRDSIMANILFPHRLTSVLFGDIFTRFLGQDHVEYTQSYVDGSDSIIPKETEIHPRPVVQRNLAFLESEGRLLTPNFTSSDFATGQDYSNHLKLLRLVEDYYCIDVTTEEGMAMVDQLVHNYDISSGEQTLERSQAVAMPMHSFDELPIMKYDGWDDCPYEPEENTTAKDFDTSALERVLNSFCQEVAKKTGEPLTLSSFKENNKLSDEQYKILRSVLHLKTPTLGANVHDIELIEKVWSVILPPSEIEKLFHDQYKKFAEDESHH